MNATELKRYRTLLNEYANLQELKRMVIQNDRITVTKRINKISKQILELLEKDLNDEEG